MSFKLPEFHIARVYDDGTQEEPQVVPVTAVPWDTRMDRRGALGLGLSATSVLAVLACDRPRRVESRDAGVVDGGVEPPRSPWLNDPVPSRTSHSPGKSKGAVKCAEATKAHRYPITSVAFSSDGNQLATACREEIVKLWTLPEGKLKGALGQRLFDGGGMGGGLSVAFNNSGDLLLTHGAASYGGSPQFSAQAGPVSLWSLAKAALVAKMEGRIAALSPDGKWLAAASANGTLDLWDLASGKFARTFAGHGRPTDRAHGGALGSLKFATDGRALAWLCRNDTYTRTLDVWSLPHGKVISSRKIEVPIIALSPDLKWAAEGGGYKLNLRALATWEVAGKVETPSTAHSLAFSDDGRWLVGTDYAPSLWVLPVPAMAPRAVLREQRGRSSSPGAPLLFGSWVVDGGKLWKLGSDQEPVTIPELSGTELVTINADGTLLAGGFYDGSVRLWQLPSGRPLGCVVDIEANQVNLAELAVGKKAVQYARRGADGRELTFTVPVGSPVPPGAMCTCNAVAGMKSRSQTICTCVPVFRRSSRRWKANVRPLDRALAKVQRLRGVRFDWTDDAPDGLVGADLGVIAEEVAEIVPELVARDESGAPIAVDYARMTALLIEAVKAQQRQIDVLRREVDRGVARTGVRSRRRGRRKEGRS